MVASLARLLASLQVPWQPLWLSCRIALVATLLSSALGIGIGLLLTKRWMPARDLVDAVTAAPLVMPPTVLGYYVLTTLGQHSAIGRMWHALTGGAIVFTRTGAVVAATIAALPLVIKTVRPALEGVDVRLLQAARTLGAGPTRVFLTVHLPLAARGIAAGVMLGFARSLGEFGITLMVAGDIPGETQTAPIAIYDLVMAMDDRAAKIMSAILSGIALSVMYAAAKLTAVKRDE